MIGSSNNILKLILVGPLPPPYSGTTVSFETLVKDLGNSNHFEVIKLIDTKANKTNRLKKIFSFIYIFFNLFWIGFKKRGSFDHIIINASNSRALVVGFFLSFFFSNVVVRFFGGAFHSRYKSFGFLRRYITRRVFLKTKVLLQTHAMIDYFIGEFKNSQIYHFPTSRNFNNFSLKRTSNKKSGSVRLIMLSEVREDKGVNVMAKAIDRLSQISGREIDAVLFGHLLPPYQDLKTGDAILGVSNFCYGGVLSAVDVPKELARADIFILPSFYAGEGYPGSIIEALMSGVPVVTTSFGPIPELVDSTCSILVTPNNVDSLVQAINNLIQDEALRQRLIEGAYKRGKMYDSNYWNGEGLYSILNNEHSAIYSLRDAKRGWRNKKLHK